MQLFKRLYAKSKNGLISLYLALLLLLSGCTGLTVRSEAPAALTEATVEPSCRAGTNADLTLCIQELRGALRSCNADKEALRGATQP